MKFIMVTTGHFSLLRHVTFLNVQTVFVYACMTCLPEVIITFVKQSTCRQSHIKSGELVLKHQLQLAEGGTSMFFTVCQLIRHLTHDNMQLVNNTDSDTMQDEACVSGCWSFQY